MKMMKKGFTLIELMIVVAIIGILAAIAIPKFADLISKSKEGATKGALSSVRGALQVYYGDNEGWFPAIDATNGALFCLTNGAKYLSSMPLAKLPGTGKTDSAAVTEEVGGTVAIPAVGVDPNGVGGWFYFNNSLANVSWGNCVVNCTQEDLKGKYLTSITDPDHTVTTWTTF
jgi:type IV pilus assembly protein PilA